MSLPPSRDLAATRRRDRQRLLIIPHPKPSVFDRVIQALIFTVIGRVITDVSKELLISICKMEENSLLIKTRRMSCLCWSRLCLHCHLLIFRTMMLCIGFFATSASPKKPLIRPNGILLSPDIPTAMSCYPTSGFYMMKHLSKPKLTPTTIIMPPPDYQPSKAEKEQTVDMPEISMNTMHDMFFRPVKVKQKH